MWFNYFFNFTSKYGVTTLSLSYICFCSTVIRTYGISHGAHYPMYLKHVEPFASNQETLVVKRFND